MIPSFEEKRDPGKEYWHFDLPERLQQEDEPPRSPWVFWACLVAECAVIGVIWWVV